MLVNEDERLRRGSSFGAVAAEYDEHRPSYPEEAIRWCLAPVAVSGGVSSGAGADGDLRGLRVLDLGAGTGKLTAQLAALGVAVTAVEPDQSMLAELRRCLPAVPASGGSAESIPLPDASVHAVLCGQSLHWFNLDRALPEIARVLVPGGVLAALWNSDDDRVEWVAGLHSAAEGAAGPTVSARRAETVEVSFGDADTGMSHFTTRVIAEFGNGQRRTAGSLAATVATYSKFLIMPQPERDRVLAQVRAYLASRPETTSEFTLPMVTSALRAIRKSADS
jgi:SAM-dependent methyltransferase